MQSAMSEMQHMAMALQPSPVDPNAPVTLEKILLTCASAPGMLASIPESHPSKPEVMEEALKKADINLDWIGTSEGMTRKNAICLCWKVNRQRAELKKTDDELDVPSQQHASACHQIAMKLLMQAQMVMPSQGWAAASVGVARASALVANQLWSHEDREALEIMADILKGEGLRAPKLRLEVSCPASSLAESPMKINVKLHRDHHGFDGKKAPAAADPSGTYEAYFVYVISIAQELGAPDSLVTVQPMICKDLKDKTIDLEVSFTAPDKVGSHRIKVLVTTTSTIGVDLSEEVSFSVTGSSAVVPDVAKLSVTDDDDFPGIKE